MNVDKQEPLVPNALTCTSTIDDRERDSVGQFAVDPRARNQRQYGVRYDQSTWLWVRLRQYNITTNRTSPKQKLPFQIVMLSVEDRSSSLFIIWLFALLWVMQAL